MRRAFTRALLVFVAVLLWSTSALGQESDTSKRVRQAEALHQRALVEWKSKKLDEAIQLWDTAISVHPSWKYAYNQALAYEYLKQWHNVWLAATLAKRLVTEDKYLGEVQRLIGMAETQLIAKRAYIELSVAPQKSKVWLNGKLWSPPYAAWVTRDRSALRIVAEGYTTHQAQWSHPIGKRTTHNVTLNPPKPAQTETPAPAEPAVVVPQKVSPVAVGSTPQWPKWVSLGASVLTLAGGVVAVGLVDEYGGDAEKLNDSPPSDYDERRDELESKHSAATISAYVLFGLSTAAAIATTVLFLPQKDNNAVDTSETRWIPLIGPTGVGLSTRF